jgi:hypothetical protein
MIWLLNGLSDARHNARVVHIAVSYFFIRKMYINCVCICSKICLIIPSAHRS